MPAADVGIEYRGLIDYASMEWCPNGGFSTPTVVGSVLDENNAAVPSEWTVELREVEGTSEWRITAARLRFTPRSAGPFHFTARFEPNITIVQGDIVSALPANPARTVLRRITLGSDPICNEMHLMPGGTLICLLGFANTAAFRVDGSPLPIAGVPGGAATGRVSGRALWTATRSTLTRWLEEDGGLVASGTASLTELPGASLAAVSEGQAFGMDSSGTSRYRWSVDAGNIYRESLPSGQVVVAGFGRVTPDGGAWWAATSLEVCPSAPWPVVSGASRGPAALPPGPMRTESGSPEAI
jgi:hypothetical protein